MLPARGPLRFRMKHGSNGGYDPFFVAGQALVWSGWMMFDHGEIRLQCAEYSRQSTNEQRNQGQRREDDQHAGKGYADGVPVDNILVAKRW